MPKAHDAHPHPQPLRLPPLRKPSSADVPAGPLPRGVACAIAELWLSFGNPVATDPRTQRKADGLEILSEE